MRGGPKGGGPGISAYCEGTLQQRMMCRGGGGGEFEEEGNLKKMKVRRGRKSEITSTRISGVVVVICDGFGSGWLLGLSCKTGSSISRNFYIELTTSPLLLPKSLSVDM